MGGAIGGAVAGGLIGGAFGLAGQALSFKYAKRMYKHRYQWAAQDLEKAGLNRILALTQGAGAASAVGPQAQISGVVEGAAKGARVSDEVALLKAKRAESESVTRLNQNNAIRVNQETLLTHTRNELLKAEIPAASAQEAFDKTMAGKVLRGVKRVKDAINPFNPRATAR